MNNTESELRKSIGKKIKIARFILKNNWLKNYLYLQDILVN